VNIQPSRRSIGPRVNPFPAPFYRKGLWPPSGIEKYLAAA
jgi:hypothetical protein